MSKSMILWMSCIACLALVLGPMIARRIDMRVAVTGYLQRAINANTAKIAASQLDTALSEIERRGWTKGTTRVFFDYPDRDIAHWYGNLTAARDELKSLPDDVTPLEQSNLLMKLRETLTEATSEGERLIVPPMLAVYPHQRPWFLWSIIGITLAVISGLYGAATLYD